LKEIEASVGRQDGRARHGVSNHGDTYVCFRFVGNRSGVSIGGQVEEL
jgi:hypothetical protein